MKIKMNESQQVTNEARKTRSGTEIATILGRHNRELVAMMDGGKPLQEIKDKIIGYITDELPDPDPIQKNMIRSIQMTKSLYALERYYTELLLGAKGMGQKNI